MKFGLGGITKALTVGSEFSTLQAVNVALNTMPNVPPVARLIATASLQFASYEILSRALKNLPPSVKGIANVALKMQMVLAGIQLIPSIMAMITAFNPSTGTSGTSGTQSTNPQSYAFMAPAPN